jgi:hypothetical protein
LSKQTEDRDRVTKSFGPVGLPDIFALSSLIYWNSGRKRQKMEIVYCASVNPLLSSLDHDEVGAERSFQQQHQRPVFRLSLLSLWKRSEFRRRIKFPTSAGENWPL